MKVKVVALLITAIEIEVLIILGPVFIGREGPLTAAVVTVSPIDRTGVVPQGDAELKYFYDTRDNSLNSIRDYPYQKDNGVTRIMALGDSFTYGAGVSAIENYPTQLEKLLNSGTFCFNSRKFEVINLGVPGYDLAYAGKRFATKGVKYNPDLIIWLITSSSRVNEFELPFIQSYIDSLNLTPEQKQAVLNNGASPSLRSEMWKNLSLAMAKSFTVSELEKYQRGVVERFAKFFTGPVVMVEFPLDPNTGVRGWPLLEGAIRGQTNIRVYRVGDDSYDPKFRLPDRHLNPEGNLALAKNLANYLKTSRLISC